MTSITREQNINKIAAHFYDFIDFSVFASPTIFKRCFFWKIRKIDLWKCVCVTSSNRSTFFSCQWTIIYYYIYILRLYQVYTNSLEWFIDSTWRFDRKKSSVPREYNAYAGVSSWNKFKLQSVRHECCKLHTRAFNPCLKTNVKITHKLLTTGRSTKQQIIHTSLYRLNERKTTEIVKQSSCQI